MKTYFLISASEVIYDYIEFQMEWDCPFLPRIGETIDPSIISGKITPAMFREAMSEESAMEWDKQIARWPDEKGVMADWIISMSLKVADVTWGMNEEGHYVTINLMEESVLKGLQEC